MAASTIPTLTYKTELHFSATESGSFTKLVDIKDYPNINTDREMVETTNLSQGVRTYIPGLRGGGDGFTFTANYIKSDFDTINAMDTGTVYYFKLLFGDNGDDGGFSFPGTISVGLIGKGVGEVREMQITIGLQGEVTPIA